jgi:uncharacterized protein
MAVTATDRRGTGESGSSTDTLLIDTDVHESLRSPMDLVPYLDGHWQEYCKQAGSLRLPGATLPYAKPPHLPARQDWKIEDGSFAADSDVVARHLFDDLGITTAILNNFLHLGTRPCSPDYNAAIARAYTAWQIEHWLEKDSRFRGSVYVVPHDPAAAVKEIDHWAEHPGIVQVFLPLVTDLEYGDPHYRPIFEAAVRNDLVVTLHHGSFTESSVGWAGWPRYFIQWHNTAQIHAIQNQVTSLVCNGVFDRYPSLKVVFLEGGVGWLPAFIWRFDQQYRELRWEIPWVKRLPGEYIRDNVRFATQPMGDLTADQFRQLVEMSETERVFLFSTDYPHYDADTAGVVLPRTLPKELLRRVRYQNALETYPRLAGIAS